MSEEFTITNSKGVLYHLNSKLVTLRGGRKQVIYYFTKDRRAEACAMPEGKTSVENPRNGFMAIKNIVK